MYSLWEVYQAMKEIKAYQCEYGCKKVLLTKQGIKRHEEKCFWNPKRKACASCKNNEPYDGDDGDSGMWCTVLEFDIFTDRYNGNSDCINWSEKTLTQ